MWEMWIVGGRSLSLRRNVVCSTFRPSPCLTHIGRLWQICHRFINLWQICHRFSSVTSSSQMNLFSGPNFWLIEFASFQLQIVHTCAKYIYLTNFHYSTAFNVIFRFDVNFVRRTAIKPIAWVLRTKRTRTDRTQVQRVIIPKKGLVVNEDA